MAEGKKQTAKEAKAEQTRKILIIRIVVAAILIAALLLSLIWTNSINRALGLVKTVEDDYDGYSTGDVLDLGGDLNVHFVDVGQGDACIIELPDDKTMLIDAGDTKTKNIQNLLGYIEENINDDQGNDITYFDYVILTHPDSDHCGGMYDVLTKYPAKTFYRPNVYSTYTKNGFTDPDTTIDRTSKNNIKDTAAYGKAIEAGYNVTNINGVESTVYITDADNEEISLIKPDVSDDDPDYYTFTFYAPIEYSFSDWNDYSPIMILDYHGRRFMFSGDSEKAGEASFVAKAQAGEGKYSVFDDKFTVDVFKLGHHGSRTSSGEGLLNVMTTPSSCPNVIAIISCGEGNSYGHPHKEVLDRLKEFGFSDENIVRTDVNGTIAMSVRGELVGDEGNRHVEYVLYMGAQTVRRTEVAIGNDTVHLTWTEIVVLGIIIVIAVIIVYPALSKKNKKKAVKAAENYARGKRK